MAVKLPDGKIARTQPEQVKKNMDDIESMKSELVIIKEGIASAYKIQGSEDVADLNALEKAEDMNGYVYNMLDAGNLVNEDASTLAVQIGDNVVFVWNGGDWYWDRLAGLVDTSNLCTLDTAQELTGKKTFVDSIDIKNGAYTWTLQTSAGGALYFQGSGFTRYLYAFSVFRPNANNEIDLGNSSYYWKDLYLSGTLYHTGYQFIWNSAYSQLRLADGSGNLRYAFNMDHSTTPISFYSYNQMDLGASNYKWKDLYLSGSVYCNDFRPSTGTEIGFRGDLRSAGGTRNIGTSSYPFGDIIFTGNLSDGTNSVAVAAIPKKILFVQATHAPQTSGTITIESYTLTADEMALIDTTKKLLLCPAKTINSGSDPVMALVSYNSTTGVLQYLNYGTGVSLSEFYLMQ